LFVFDPNAPLAARQAVNTTIAPGISAAIGTDRGQFEFNVSGTDRLEGKPRLRA
jgi:hypothetical protein